METTTTTAPAPSNAEVAYTEWTPDEERALLMSMVIPRVGGHRKAYSQVTTRSRAAIRGKLQRMGLVSPRPRKPAFTP